MEMLRTGIFILTTVLISNPSLAQSCMDAIPSKTVKDDIACLKEELQNRPPIPSGTVAAFDLQGGCPPGWYDFTPAAGRFIIAVDNKKYKLPYNKGEPDYQIDGNTTITLEAPHLPDHRHQIPVHNSNSGTKATAFQNNGGLGWNPDGLTKKEERLQGTPIEIMPPYIALYMCKKCKHTNCEGEQ